MAAVAAAAASLRAGSVWRRAMGAPTTLAAAATAAAAAASRAAASPAAGAAATSRTATGTRLVSSSSAPAVAVTATPPVAAAAAAAAIVVPPPPPLLPELPGMPHLTPLRGRDAPKLQVTTLPSGFRVVSQETYAQVASAALFIEAGSMYEKADTQGACHFLEMTAFKGSQRRGGDEITRFLMSHGLGASASFNKEVMMYRVDFLRGDMGKALDLLFEAAFMPAFSPDLLATSAQAMAFQRSDLAAQPQVAVSDNLFAAAYGAGTPLGRAEKCPEAAIHTVTADTLRTHMARHYVAPRMVLSLVGVEHGAAVEAVARSSVPLPSLPPDAAAALAPHWKRPVVPYVGGEVRVSPDWASMPATAVAATAKTEFSHAMLAFPTVGWSDDDVVPVCVVDTLLGGGSSFSAGGPGKGLYSRVYREVLNAHAWAEAANAFSSQLYASGLLGVYAAAPPAHIGELVQLMAEQLARLALVPVTPVELSRARNQLASSVMMNLETRGLLAEDIGRQILSHGKRMEITELMRRIQAVTPDDLMRVVRQAIAHPPALSAVGDHASIPPYADIQAYFAAVSAKAAGTASFSSFFRR